MLFIVLESIDFFILRVRMNTTIRKHSCVRKISFFIFVFTDDERYAMTFFLLKFYSAPVVCSLKWRYTNTIQIEFVLCFCDDRRPRYRHRLFSPCNGWTEYLLLLWLLRTSAPGTNAHKFLARVDAFNPIIIFGSRTTRTEKRIPKICCFLSLPFQFQFVPISDLFTFGCLNHKMAFRRRPFSVTYIRDRCWPSLEHCILLSQTCGHGIFFYLRKIPSTVNYYRIHGLCLFAIGYVWKCQRWNFSPYTHL